MPIPLQRRPDYGLDWAFLSFNMLMRRAGQRCECTGECSGVNGHLDPGDGRCRNRHGQPRWSGGRLRHDRRPVILSLAHLDHDPAGRDPSRMLILCEGCHLRLDANQHWATRRQNFEEQAGLIALFDLV